MSAWSWGSPRVQVQASAAGGGGRASHWVVRCRSPGRMGLGREIGVPWRHATVTTTSCQPVAPDGNGVRALLGSGWCRCDRWRARAACAARARRPRRAPTAATCRRWGRRRASPRATARRRPAPRRRRCPGAAPSRRRRSRRGRPPRSTAAAATSMRAIVRTGASVAQPRCVQYACLGGVRRGLDRDHPLGRRDEAEQAGHDHPCREPVLRRQRLAVHADGDDRVAPVRDRGDRRARRPAVDRSSTAAARRAGSTPARSSRSRRRTPSHTRVAGVRARRPRSTRRSRVRSRSTIGMREELVVGQREGRARPSRRR